MAHHIKCDQIAEIQDFQSEKINKSKDNEVYFLNTDKNAMV